ncbi:MAG: V-type ATPase subunit [Candidatus Hydrogenedentes bacterium]|nr:V-type ATPase subunit [Candidatus Hydrogenedentota bacterium]
MMRSLTRYAIGNVGARVSLSEILTKQDLTEIVEADSMAGAWAVLENTAFGEFLPHYSEQTPLEVERLLHIATGSRFRRAISSLRGRPRKVALILLSRWDLDALILTLRRWHGEARSEGDEYNYPGLVDDLSTAAISKAENLLEITEALRKTPYGSPLLKIAPAYGEKRSMSIVETALERNYYERLFAAVRALGNSDSRDAETLIAAEVDVLNLAAIARRLHYYQGSALGDLSELVIPSLSLLTRRLADSDLTPESFNDILFAHLQGSFPGMAAKLPLLDKVALLETMMIELTVDLARKSFSGFPFRVTCILALYILKRVELKNLRAVFAGKASGLDGEAILAKLHGLERFGGDAHVNAKVSLSTAPASLAQTVLSKKRGA